MIEREDAEFLAACAPFRRFLYAVIQNAGIISNEGAADGRTALHVSHEFEAGRRSLGHEILLMVEDGQPDALRSPDGAPLATLNAVILEAINPKEKPRGNRSTSDRYDRDYDDGDERG